MKKVLNFIFKTNTGLISLLLIACVGIYFADGKLTRYIQVGQEVFSATGYDSKSPNKEKQSSPKFEYVQPENYSNLVHSIELSIDFLAYSFSNWQTLLDVSSRKGIIIDINSGGEVALDYYSIQKKYLVNLLNKNVPLEKDKTNHLEIIISKDGNVISILNGKQIAHEKLDSQSQLSPIKFGENIKNERIFDGKIDNFNLKYVSYRKSYLLQNISTLLLSIIIILAIGGLFNLHYEFIVQKTQYIVDVSDRNGAYFEKVKVYLSQNLFNFGFAFCSIAVFFYILPIILANVPYMDDYDRTIGQYYWNRDSRFLSSYLYKLFSLKSKLAVFAPWGLIIGSFILCASAYLFSRKFAEKNVLASSVAVVYLFSSPFLLQPLSYQLDILPMLFSVVFCLWIFLIPDKGIFMRIASTFIFTFCCLLTYQTSIAVIPILVLFEFIMLIKNEEDHKIALKLLFTRFCSFGASVIVWYFAIYNNSRFVSKDIAHSSNLFVSLFDRIDKISNSILNWQPYNNFTLIILCLLFAAFCAIVISFAIKLPATKTVSSRICKVIIAISPLIMLFMALFGVNAVQTFTIDPRHFFAFAVFLFVIIFFVFSFYSGILRYIFIFLSIIPLLYSFGLSYSYGNALRCTYDMNMLLANSLMNVIHDDKEILIAFNGKMERPKKLSNLYKVYPFIDRLCERWKWNGVSILRYYGFKVKNDKDKTDKALMCINEANIVSTHYYYNLLQYDDIYIVDFKKTDLNN
jgi:hypothetical protein